MKYFFCLCFFLFFISCSTNTKHENPNWLKGKWIRVNNEKNKSTYEFWENNFSGLGFTLREKDTVFTEKMSIINNKGKMYFVVTGLDQKPTFFEFTHQSKNSFIAENSNNPFPKKIKYSLEKDTLKAVIANNQFDEFSVDFSYVKIKK